MCCWWYLLHVNRLLVWRVNSSEKMADNLEQQSELFGGSEDASSVCDEERVRKLFQACDGDGDGYIDRYVRTFFSVLVLFLSSLVLIAPVFSSDLHTVLKIVWWRTCSAEVKQSVNVLHAINILSVWFNVSLFLYLTHCNMTNSGS